MCSISSGLLAMRYKCRFCVLRVIIASFDSGSVSAIRSCISVCVRRSAAEEVLVFRCATLWLH